MTTKSNPKPNTQPPICCRMMSPVSCSVFALFFLLLMSVFYNGFYGYVVESKITSFMTLQDYVVSALGQLSVVVLILGVVIIAKLALPDSKVVETNLKKLGLTYLLQVIVISSLIIFAYPFFNALIVLLVVIPLLETLKIGLNKHGHRRLVFISTLPILLLSCSVISGMSKGYIDLYERDANHVLNFYNGEQIDNVILLRDFEKVALVLLSKNNDVRLIHWEDIASISFKEVESIANNPSCKWFGKYCQRK